MPRIKRVTLENGCYHIITRGNQKQSVFQATEDYQRYLYLLSKYKRKFGFKLYCFCLMPNHVHLLIQVSDPNVLNKIMRGLNLSYTLYFNFRYKKVGHLWQDRYKSRIIQQDAYLLECINYIEANPVRASLAGEIEEYPWSSQVLKNKKSKLVDNLFSF